MEPYSGPHFSAIALGTAAGPASNGAVPGVIV